MDTLPSRREQAAEKVARVRALLLDRGATALCCTRIANFAWLTCGGRAFINIAAEGGAAWIVITKERVAVITSNIEAERLREEELADLDLEVVACPWWEGGAMAAALRAVAGPGATLLADGGIPGAGDASAALMALRTQLTAAEQAAAVTLGQELAAALEQTCRQLQVGQTEFAVAGQLAAACYDRGIEPIVHLVAADERTATRRHPLPTTRTVRRYVMVVVCGLRQGLVLSCTRLVHFGPIGDDLLRRWRAAAAVDAEMIAASRPGARAGAVFAAARAAYARAGFPDEWTFHHQGGLAGYASREWRALPDGPEVITQGQILAWNPSVAGAKSEDTVLVTGPGVVPRVITKTGEWPTAPFETSGGQTVRRPEILIR